MRKQIPVVYSANMVGREDQRIGSVFAKPRHMADFLKSLNLDIEWVDPKPLAREDFHRAHNSVFVDQFLDEGFSNGFGYKTPEVMGALPFIYGAIYEAAVRARERGFACALTSGFAQGQFDQAARACAFNGFMVAATKLMAERQVQRIAILDFDFTRGDETQKLIDTLGLSDRLFYYGAAKYFQDPRQSTESLEHLRKVLDEIQKFQPEILFYQAGVEAFRRTPSEGVYTLEEITVRDRMIFEASKDADIPVAWLLGDGDHRDGIGSLQPTLDLHYITFEEACLAHDVYAESIAKGVLTVLGELYLQGEYDSVDWICEHWLNQFPHLVDYWKLLGVTRGAQGRHEEAYFCFLRAFELQADDGEILSYLISASLHLRKVDRALTVITRDVTKLSWREQKVVARNILHMIRERKIALAQLPEPLRTLLARERGE